MIKLVAIDMDETLLRQNKSFDKKRFHKIYQEFIDREMILTIASGNSYPKLDEYFTFMNHNHLYFAADNGNYTVKRGEVIKKNVIEHDELLEAVALLEEIADFSIVLSDGDNVYTKWVNPKFEEYVLSFNNNLKYIDSYDEMKNLEIVKVASHSSLPLEEIKEIAQNIIDRFPYLDAVTSGGGWLDFYHIGGGKGSAVEALQEKYSVSWAETMVFGDSLNDASMVEHAKYSIAMGNGDEELKALSNYQIGTNEKQAVFDVLETLLDKSSVEFMEKYRIKK